jgi:membrane-associated phospholipid phosphatase
MGERYFDCSGAKSAYDHGVLFLTDLADPAVILPAAFVIAVMLALTGWTRGTLVWLAAVFGTIATIAVLKIGFAACGPTQFGGPVNSPSGHVAGGTIAYGGLVALLTRYVGVSRGWALLPVPLIAALIGLTRIELGAHTLPEVVIGGVIGCAGVFAMLALAGVPPGRLRVPRLLGPAVLVVAIMHGHHVNGEALVKQAGWHWEWLAAACGDHRPVARS